MSQAPERSPEGPQPGTIGSPFIELQSVDSTNNYAREQIHAGLARHGMTIFTHEQVTGRGQRGRVWASEKDMNIALSIVIKPQPLQLSQQFQFSACTAVAVHDFFSRYALDKVSVKWPNDLYWQDRKAGGILIESVIGTPEPVNGALKDTGEKVSGWQWAITGIGININQTVFPDYLPNPVSLKQITGSDFKLLPLARVLCQSFQHYYDELTTKGFDNIHRLYNDYLYKRNETVRLKKENRIFEALIRGVSDSGRLMTQHAIEEEFDHGQVEWLV